MISVPGSLQTCIYSFFILSALICALFQHLLFVNLNWNDGIWRWTCIWCKHATLVKYTFLKFRVPQKNFPYLVFSTLRLSEKIKCELSYSICKLWMQSVNFILHLKFSSGIFTLWNRIELKVCFISTFRHIFKNIIPITHIMAQSVINSDVFHFCCCLRKLVVTFVH